MSHERRIPPGVRVTASLQRALEEWQASVMLLDQMDPVTTELVRLRAAAYRRRSGATVDPWGNLRSGFDASTRIDRDQFGITWNQALEAGGFLVGKEILVEIDVEAIHQNEG